jgi:hypothetical protein
MHMFSVKNLIAGILFAAAVVSRADNIDVPNYSFEQPPVPPGAPAYPVFDNWQKFPQPAYWDEAAVGPWNNVTGVFPNPASGEQGHIDNVDAAQAAYIFATPGSGIFQDMNTKFESGKAYSLTVAITSSTQIPPTTNTPISIALYYRDAQSNIVTVATKSVQFNDTNFPNPTHMVDISLKSDAIRSGSPALDKNIGISISSASDFNNAGGVWDADNVRLTAVRELVEVPNFSFESPTVPPGAPAYPVFDNWQKFPQPAYWDEATVGPWNNVTGVFPNPAPGEQGHIDNVDGAQAAYIFATPGSGIYQDLSTKFESGNAYKLTVAITSSTQVPPTTNTPITIALYYRDAQSNMVTVATKTLQFNDTNFPNPVHMVDLSVTSDTVRSGAPYAGKNIGVSISSAADFSNAGGVWDADNVRITVGHAVTLRTSIAGSNLRLSWDSIAGTPYQILTAPNVVSPFSVLTQDPITGNGGELSIDLPLTGSQAFFEVRALTP